VEQGALDALFDGWANHQRRAIDMLAGLTPDQLALRPSLDSWSVWQLAGHVAGSRSYWFQDLLGEGDPSLRVRFRVASTTVPGLSLEDAGWEDDETHPRGAAELVGALEDTWVLVGGCLRRWTSEDLAVSFSRQRSSGTQTFTRSWVIWHLIEHDVHHTGEMSIILGSHGVPGLDL
jgi:uncharacterized damage-inducible protein DinB